MVSELPFVKFLGSSFCSITPPLKLLSTYSSKLKWQVGNSPIFVGDTSSGWWFQIFAIFTPIIGKIPILTHIFQMIDGLVQPPISLHSLLFFHCHLGLLGDGTSTGKALARAAGDAVLEDYVQEMGTNTAELGLVLWYT